MKQQVSARSHTPLDDQTISADLKRLRRLAGGIRLQTVDQTMPQPILRLSGALPGREEPRAGGVVQPVRRAA